MSGARVARTREHTVRGGLLGGERALDVASLFKDIGEEGPWNDIPVRRYTFSWVHDIPCAAGCSAARSVASAERRASAASSTGSTFGFSDRFFGCHCVISSSCLHPDL